VEAVSGWFGHLPQWNSSFDMVHGGPLWSKESFVVGANRPVMRPAYSTCDTAESSERSAFCFSSCCAMSHQAIMVDAYHFKGYDQQSRILILEDDATPGPALFDTKTITIMQKLSQRTDWGMLKLGECLSYSDDERILLSAKEQCASATTEEKHTVPYQYLTSLVPGKVGMDTSNLPLIDNLEPHDGRTHRSFCSHAYMVNGPTAGGIISTHFPAKSNCDNQMTESCEMRGDVCLRLEKNVFNQNHTMESALPSSCHPCEDGAKKDSMTHQRPFLFTVNAQGLSGTASSAYPILQQTCQSHGLELCPPRAYCQTLDPSEDERPYARSRMVDAWFNSANDPNWNRFKTMYENWVEPKKIWMPVSHEPYGSWLHLQTCQVHRAASETLNSGGSGSDRGTETYAETLTGTMHVGCCPADEPRQGDDASGQ